MQIEEIKKDPPPGKAPVSDLEMLAAFERMTLPADQLSQEERDGLAEKVEAYYSGHRAPAAPASGSAAREKFAIDELSEETREGLRRLAGWENGG